MSIDLTTFKFPYYSKMRDGSQFYRTEEDKSNISIRFDDTRGMQLLATVEKLSDFDFENVLHMEPSTEQEFLEAMIRQMKCAFRFASGHKSFSALGERALNLATFKQGAFDHSI